MRVDSLSAATLFTSTSISRRVEVERSDFGAEQLRITLYGLFTMISYCRFDRHSAILN